MNSLKKQNIIRFLIDQLQKEHELYERIAEQARKEAIDSEMKQEGKYDTRAIEAGYLAGAQKRRFEEIKLDIQNLEALQVKDLKGSPASLGALVKLDDGHWYFLAPVAGGTQVELEGESIKVLSIQSPLARNLIGLEEGESFVLDTPAGSKELAIESIL